MFLSLGCLCLLYCFLLADLGPVIAIYGENYFFIEKKVIEKNPFVSPVFIGDTYELEIPCIIFFYLTKNNNKNLRINFLPSFTPDDITFKPKVNNIYLDDIAGVKINLLEYHTKEGMIFNLLECNDIKNNDGYMEIDFSKKIAFDDVLKITGIDELKNGSEIHFYYKYKIKVTPFRMETSLRILGGTP